MAVDQHVQRKQTVHKNSKFKDLPVAADEAVWTHTLTIQIGGLAANPSTALPGTQRFAGVATHGFDNTGSPDGTLAPMPERWCKVSKSGRWLFTLEAASPAPEIGADAFVFDNDQVTADGNGRVRCGRFWSIEPSGEVWIDIDGA